MDIAEPTFYRHRQIGWPLIVPAVLSIAALEVYLAMLPASAHDRTSQWLPIGLAAIILLLFYGLEISVTRSQLIWRFGIGLISGRAALDDIVASEPTRTSIASGWGIRFTRRGMLYNIAGFDALLLTRKNGKTFLLGSDDIAHLNGTLQMAIHERERQRVG